MKESQYWFDTEEGAREYADQFDDVSVSAIVAKVGDRYLVTVRMWSVE